VEPGPAHAQVSTTRLLKATILFGLPGGEVAQTVVVGQHDPARDVAAVQAAVDQGGSVLLLGTFDFGDDGRVLLQKSVRISGEADASDVPITTIMGGDWPFLAPAPSSMPPAQAGPVISVENICFRQPSGGAIHLVYTGGAYIRGNKVTEIRRRPFTTFLRGAGVLIGPCDVPIAGICTRLVTGSIVVMDNEVHRMDPCATKTSVVGVFVHPSDEADVYIRPRIACATDRTREPTSSEGCAPHQ
jgi:hypothetical protein